MEKEKCMACIFLYDILMRFTEIAEMKGDADLQKNVNSMQKIKK